MAIDIENIFDAVEEIVESDWFGSFLLGIVGVGIVRSTVWRSPSKALLAELRNKIQKLTRLQNEYSVLRQKFEKIQKEIEKLNEQIKSHRQAYQQKSKEISELKEKIAAIESKAAMQSETERARYAKEKADLERQLEKLKQENQQHIEQVEKLEQRLEELEKKSQDKKREVGEVIYTKAKNRISNRTSSTSFTVSYQQGTNILQGKLTEIIPGRDIMFRAVFGAIERHHREGEFSDLEYYTMDVPMQIDSDRQLVRITRKIGDDTLRCNILKPYESEPMFPRLFKRGSTKAIELPKKTRKQANSNLYYFTNSKCPWTERQIEILQTVLEQPNLSNQQLATKLGVSISTIESHYKEIQKTAMEILMLKFQPRKLLAHYWHEMGFIFI